MDELKVGDVCRLLPNPTTGPGGKVYFSASVTRVRLGLQSSDGWRVVALDGVTERGPNEAILYGAGLTQWVAARFLVPLEIDNDEAADGDEMKAVLVGTGIEYELSVAQVIANLEEHRATLAEAHALLIGQAVDAQIHARTYPARLADHLAHQAELLRTGEAVVDPLSGALVWADKNRDDLLPTVKVGLSVKDADRQLEDATERRDQALAAQDENLAFLRAIGTPTVRVDRDTYEDWFVDLP